MACDEAEVGWGRWITQGLMGLVKEDLGLYSITLDLRLSKFFP